MSLIWFIISHLPGETGVDYSVFDVRLSVCLSYVVSGWKLNLGEMDLNESWYMCSLGDNIEWD